MPTFTPEHWRTVEAVFLAAGFQFARQQGSHRSYVKPGAARPVVIQAYKEVPVFVIRNNLKTAGLSRDEYFAYFAVISWPLGFGIKAKQRLLAKISGSKFVPPGFGIKARPWHPCHPQSVCPQLSSQAKAPR